MRGRAVWNARLPLFREASAAGGLSGIFAEAPAAFAKHVFRISRSFIGASDQELRANARGSQAFLRSARPGLAGMFAASSSRVGGHVCSQLIRWIGKHICSFSLCSA